MKTSDKLYNINRKISLKCVALQQKLTISELSELNRQLGKIVGEIRKLEDEKNL